MPKKQTKRTKKKTAASALPLGRFISGEIRVIKKAGRKVVQFRRTKAK